MHVVVRLGKPDGRHIPSERRFGQEEVEERTATLRVLRGGASLWPSGIEPSGYMFSNPMWRRARRGTTACSRSESSYGC